MGVFCRVVILGVLVSCGGGAPPAVEPSRPAAARPAGESRAGDAVQVLEAGAAPRRPLRFRFHAGATEFLEFDERFSTLIVTGDAKPGRQENRTEPPTIRITIRAAVSEVAADGQAAIAFVVERVRTLDDVALEPPARAGLETRLAELVGMRIRGRLSALGVPSDIVVDLPPGVSAAERQMLDRLKDSLDKLYLPMPEQPVGVGATWIMTARTPVNGISSTVRYRCTVTRLDAASATLAVALQFASDPQELHIDGAHGVTTMLDSLTGSGKGSMTLQWDHLVPISAVSSSVDGSFTVTGSDGSELHSTLHMTIALASRQGKHAEDRCEPAEVRVAVLRGLRLKRDKSFGLANAQFERACGCHDADGCGFLGFSYVQGIGVAADPARAAQLFEQACGPDPVPASRAVFCDMLGLMYRDGHGVTRDPVAALALFRRACDAGWAAGCSGMGSMLEDGIGAPRDAVAAIAAYTRGCDGRDAHGCLSLSRVFESGKLGTRRDPARAAELKDRACELCAEKKCTFLTGICPAPAPP